MTAPNRNEPPPGCEWGRSEELHSGYWWSLGDEEQYEEGFTDVLAAAWSAYDRIHGKPDHIPDAGKMVGQDHSGEPNDMTRELAEALEAVLLGDMGDAKAQAQFGGYVLDPDVRLIVCAVLNKWRATRKEQP